MEYTDAFQFINSSDHTLCMPHGHPMTYRKFVNFIQTTQAQAQAFKYIWYDIWTKAIANQVRHL